MTNVRVPLGGAGKNELVFVTGYDRDNRFVVDVAVISYVAGILAWERVTNWAEAAFVTQSFTHDKGLGNGDRWIWRIMTREHLGETADAEDLILAARHANLSAYHVH